MATTPGTFLWRPPKRPWKPSERTRSTHPTMQPSIRANAENKTFETSDGCVVAYTLRAGSTPSVSRIALIHSLALDGGIWDRVVGQLAGKADSVLTYDCRGHGRSGRPRMPFTLELFARDLAELLNHVGWPAASVAGCSMGGGVAQAFAAMFPARTTALGLIDTTAWYGADAPKTWRERAANARAKGLGGMVDFQLTRWFSDEFSRRARGSGLRHNARVFLATDLDCYAASCVMLRRFRSATYSLETLRMPVAIVVGATGLRDAGRCGPADARRDSRLHSDRHCRRLRHLTPIECPEQVAAQLLGS